MQKAKINYFKDRTIYYTTFPIRNMADKGGWDFNLKPVFCIAILDFEFHSVNRKKTDHISYVELKDQYCQRFYDKLNYIFIEMPKFKKTESELTTHFDKWLYFLKHLEDFDTIPEILNEPVFMDALSKAEKANYNEKQMMEYERSLMNYWDATAMIKTAFDDGRAEGKIEDKKETLCRQMSRKFQMNSGDIEIINKCEDVTNLDDALDEFVFADSKEVVLDKLG